MDKTEFIKQAPMYYALAIAVRLAVREDDEYVFEGELKAEYTDDPQTGTLLWEQSLFNEGISTLAEHRMIDTLPDRFGPELFKKAASFSEQFTTMSQDRSSPFFRYALVAENSRHHWLESALISVNMSYRKLGITPQDFETPEQEQEQIPFESSEQEWEPIPLDRTDEKLQAAIVALDETVEQLRSDNGYAATYPEERKFVLTKLQTITKSLKEDAEISWMYVKDFALEPLGMLIKRYGLALLGGLAEVAKTAVKEWIKSKLDNLFK
jgi:hypothetical protein